MDYHLLPQFADSYYDSEVFLKHFTNLHVLNFSDRCSDVATFQHHFGVVTSPSFIPLIRSVPQIQRNQHFNSSRLLLPSKGEPILGWRQRFSFSQVGLERNSRKFETCFTDFENSLQDGRNPSLPRMYKISVDSGINSLLTRLPDLFHQKYGSRFRDLLEIPPSV